MKYDAIKLHSQFMQALIVQHANEALEFVNHLLLEDDEEREEVNVKRFAAMVANATIEFLAQDLDVDHGNPDVVPKDLQAAIQKFVLDNMRVQFDWG